MLGTPGAQVGVAVGGQPDGDELALLAGGELARQPGVAEFGPGQQGPWPTGPALPEQPGGDLLPVGGRQRLQHFGEHVSGAGFGRRHIPTIAQAIARYRAIGA